MNVTVERQPLAEVRVSVRPARLAYFVPAGRRAEFLAAARLATTHVGGLRNLIMPFDRATGAIDAASSHYLRIHSPDSFVIFGDSTQRSAVERAVAAVLPRRTIKVLLGEGMVIENQFARTASRRDTADSWFRVRSVIGCTREVSAAMFGDVPLDDHELRGSAVALGVERLECGSEKFWTAQLSIAPADSVLNFANNGLRTVEARRPIPGGGRFDLVVGTSLADLCMFWNARATRDVVDCFDRIRRTVLVPNRALSRESLETLRDVIIDRRDRPGFVAEVDCLILTRAGINRERVRRRFVDAGFDVEGDNPRAIREPKSRRSSGDAVSAAFHDIDQRIPTDADDFDEAIGQAERVLVDIVPGRVDIMAGRVAAGLSPDLWALDLRSEAWDALPRYDAVARLLLQTAWFGSRGLSVFIRGGGEGSVTLNVPGTEDCLRAVGGSVGLDLRVLESGHHIAALVAASGHLRDLGVLSKRWAFELLPTLSRVHAGKRRAAQIPHGAQSRDVEAAAGIAEMHRMIDAAPFPKPRTLAELLRQARTPDGVTGIEWLVDRRILRRGIQTRCPSCRLRLFYLLASVSESMTCQGCSRVFSLPFSDDGARSQELKWSYVINPLFERAVDQDYLPAALAARLIARQSASAYGVCFNVGVSERDSKTQLTDLDAVVVTKSGAHAIEAKAGPSLFPVQARTVLDVAERLRFTTITFATAETWNDDAKRLLSTLTKELRARRALIRIRSVDGATLFDPPST